MSFVHNVDLGALARRTNWDEKSFHCWFPIPMELYLCSLPLMRLIDDARHQLNLCSASDAGLPLAWCLKHTLALDAHREHDRANL